MKKIIEFELAIKIIRARAQFTESLLCIDVDDVIFEHKQRASACFSSNAIEHIAEYALNNVGYRYFLDDIESIRQSQCMLAKNDSNHHLEIVSLAIKNSDELDILKNEVNESINKAEINQSSLKKRDVKLKAIINRARSIPFIKSISIIKKFTTRTDNKHIQLKDDLYTLSLSVIEKLAMTSEALLDTNVRIEQKHQYESLKIEAITIFRMINKIALSAMIISNKDNINIDSWCYMLVYSVIRLQSIMQRFKKQLECSDKIKPSDEDLSVLISEIKNKLGDPHPSGFSPLFN